MAAIRTRLFQTWFRLSRPMTLGVRAIIENEAGEVLLVRHTYTKGLFFPGGGIERGETAGEALERELQEEAGDETSAEAVAARWSDAGARRSLFDRALVGRLSSAVDTPVIDYLVGCFVRVADLKARKSSQGALAQGELGELLDYVSELCVSYSAIALANPTMFPQPAEAEAEGVTRLLRHLRANSLPASFLSRLVANVLQMAKQRIWRRW